MNRGSWFVSRGLPGLKSETWGTRPPAAQKLRAAAQNLYGFCTTVKGKILSKLLIMLERIPAVQILRGF